MKREFTLLELIVVMAIFGILLSLLLPSLWKARDVSIAAVCLSNEKQIYTGYAQSVAQNNGNMPSSPYNDLSANQSWPCVVDQYVGGNFDPNESDWRKFSKKGASEIWYCPMTKGKPSSRSDRIDYGKTSRVIYNGNDIYQYNFSTGKAASLAKVDSPSGQMFLADGSDSDTNSSAWEWTEEQLTNRNHDNSNPMSQERWNAYAAPRHIGFKKENIMFFDGSGRVNAHGDAYSPSITKLYWPE
ncbi:MAG: type II secretion system GspH family protein [Lentisphaeraceae bacterium]|nr:type II secretion system GspH family protein [Lentisphaeraceae bacterium]